MILQLPLLALQMRRHAEALLEREKVADQMFADRSVSTTATKCSARHQNLFDDELDNAVVFLFVGYSCPMRSDAHQIRPRRRRKEKCADTGQVLPREIAARLYATCAAQQGAVSPTRGLLHTNCGVKLPRSALLLRYAAILHMLFDVDCSYAKEIEELFHHQKSQSETFEIDCSY